MSNNKTNKSTSNREVISSSVIYTISGLLTKCVSFFLLPLYTAYLTAEDYGIINISGSFVTTMCFVVAFSLFSAILRFYVDLKEDPEKLKRFYGTMVTFVFLSGLAFFVILFTGKNLLVKYVFNGTPFYPVILISLISLITSCEHKIYENVLRSQQKAMRCSVLSVIYFLINVVLTVAFVVFCKMGAVGTLLASMISGAIYTTYFVLYMLVKGEMTICIDGALLKSALRYSIPIMPHDLSTHIVSLISKVLIGGKASLGALGIYAVATQFGGIADTIQTYVSNAYNPWLFENLKEQKEGYENSLRKVVKLLISIIGLFFIAISLFAHDYIVLLVDEKFVTAWKYVPLIILTYAIKTTYYFYLGILLYFKQASKKVFIATLTSSLVNLILSFIFIPIYGAIGSIMADALSMVVRVAIVIWLSRYYKNIGLRVIDFIVNGFRIVLFTALGLSVSYFYFPYEFSWINLVFKVFVIFVYSLIVLLPYKKELRAGMNSILHKSK